jgi:hypothetical protein
VIQKKLESIRVRTVGGRFRYDIKYWGAGITGRFSGAGGVNIQNLSGKELYGVNMRKSLVAAPGMKLVASDLSQIEPRCGCYFAQEHEAMAEMAAGISPYIVYARQAMGLAPDQTWEKTDTRYKVAKESVLGCGYVMGHHKFLVTIEGKVPKGQMKEADVQAILDAPLEFESCEERYLDYISKVNLPKWNKFWEQADEKTRHRLLRSWEVVTTFRTGRPKLVDLWARLGTLAKTSAARNEDCVIDLPSGRSLVYKSCRLRRRPKSPDEKDGGWDVVADVQRNGMQQTTRIHSGIIIENMCQALARDAFRDCLLRVHDAGYKILFHVHDEVVVEVEASRAEHAAEDIEKIMGIPPSWAPTLPVAAESTIADSYDQAK